MGDVRTTVVGAAAAGLFAAASTQLALGPRGEQGQLVAGVLAAGTGLGVGLTVGAVAGRIPSRVVLPVAAAALVGGAATWLAAGGRPGEGRSPVLASAGFLAAAGGTGLLVDRAFAGLGRSKAGMLGVGAGLLAGALLIGSAGVLHGRRADAPRPPAGSKAPWSLGTAERGAVAAGAGALVAGAAVGVAALASTVRGSRYAAPITIGAAALGALGLGAGALAIRSVVAGFGSGRLDPDEEIAPNVTGGSRSGLQPDELPSDARRYLTSPMSVERISAYWPRGTAIETPVRAYAPLASGSDAASRAEAVVDELERLGGLDRSTIHVFVPTGSGGLYDNLVDVAEIYGKGDVATVGVQYCDKPSVVSMNRVGDGVEHLRATLEAIDARLDQLPPGTPRPRVVLSGYSLGAEVIRTALAADPQLAALTDGVLAIGPRSLASGPLPTGPHVVIADTAEQLAAAVRPAAGLPPVGIIRHTADPIGAISARSLLGDERDPEMLDQSLHVPVVSFTNQLADFMTLSRRDAQEGAPWHGHGYGAELTDGVRATLFPGELVPESVADRVGERTVELIDASGAG